MKRARFLWPLTQGHMHGLLAAKHIRWRLEADPKDPDLAGEVRALQQDDLEPHFQAEEAMVATLEVRWGAEDPDLVRFHSDHAAMRAWVVEGTPEALRSFADMLTAHIRFEEDVLYGRFEAALTAEESEAWSARLQSVVSPNPHIPRPPHRS